MRLQLRPDQQQAIDAIFKYLPVGNPVIAMPGGTGKSLVIAEFIRTLLYYWPNSRILIATHTKELVAQDAEALRAQWPEAPYGILSAGLGKDDTVLPIIFCNVQSAVNRLEQLGRRDVLIIDEAHLLSPEAETRYSKLVNALQCRVVGLSATPYRLGQGYITQDGIFNKIVFDTTHFKDFNRYIEEGIICTLYPKATKTKLDVSEVPLNMGEFAAGALQDACDKDRTTWNACTEIVEELPARNSCLVFCTGINHVKHTTECLLAMGVRADCVHSKMGKNDRDRVIQDFRQGRLQALVNNGILTTGFNHPPLDLIANLRPTNSSSLWVQMLSRGTRISPNKNGTLVLDFAYNTERLGPINDPIPPRPPGGGNAPRVAPIRICPNCGIYNHASSLVCCYCGLEFPRSVGIFSTADTAPIIKTEEPIISRIKVDRIIYLQHNKNGAAPMMKVSYLCPSGVFDEYICLEHSGFASKKARDWWRNRTGEEPPVSTEKALALSSQLKVPIAIDVHTNKRYPTVEGYIYE